MAHVTSQPVITRGTTKTVSWVALLTVLLRLILQPDPTPDWFNNMLAIVIAASYVTSLVSLVFGLVLAWRARSVLWALAVLFFGPAGSVACALWSKQPGEVK